MSTPIFCSISGSSSQLWRGEEESKQRKGGDHMPKTTGAVIETPDIATAVWPGLQVAFQIKVSQSFSRTMRNSPLRAVAAAFLKNAARTSDIVLDVCPHGMRCQWGGSGSAQPSGSLVQLGEGPAYWVLDAQKTFVPFQQRELQKDNSGTATIDSGRTTPGDSGLLRLKEFHRNIGITGDLPLHLRVWQPEQQPATRLPLDTWWSAMLPYFAGALKGLGLPARIELFLGQELDPSIVMTMTARRASKFGPSHFIPPSNYGLTQPRQVDGPSRTSKRRREDGQTAHSRSELSRPEAAPGAASFALPLIGGDIKLAFNGNLVSKVVKAINSAWSYLDRFHGQNFVFNTDTWVTQLTLNAPAPGTDTAKSVAPGLIARFGFYLLWQSIKAVRADPLQLALLQSALNITGVALVHPWSGFLLSLSALENTKLGAMLDQQRYTETAFGLDLVSDISGASGSQPAVGGLGRKWLTFLTPNLPLTQSNGRTTGIRPDKSIIMEGVADLIDVTFSDWQNTIELSRRPLLDDPQFVDRTNLNLVLPGTMAPGDFAAGLFTQIRVAGVQIQFSVSTTPTTDSVLVAGLIFFCPPCFVALWEWGIGTISLSNLVIPILVYPSRTDPVTAPTQLKTLVGTLQSDTSTTLLIAPGIVPFLQLEAALSLIGTFIGGPVLHAIIASLNSKVQDLVNKVLATLPPLQMSAVVRLDRPSFSLPPLGPVIYQGERQGQGYLLDAMGIIPPVNSSSTPLEHPSDADIALLLSNLYFHTQCLPLRTPPNGDFRYPTEGLPTDGKLVDWWRDPPAQAGVRQPPVNMFAPPPPPIAIMAPGAQLNSVWSLSSQIRVSPIMFPQVLSVNDPAPGDPVAQWRCHIVVEVDATQLAPQVTEFCNPAQSGVVPKGGAVSSGPGGPIGPGPNGPPTDVIGPPYPIGPYEPGSLIATIHPIPVGDPGALSIPGSLPGGWNPQSFHASFALTPPPDADGIAQIPGTFMVCQWAVTWNIEKQETWLRLEADYTYSYAVGLLDVLVLNDASTLHFLPTIASRILSGISGDDLQNVVITTNSYLTWFDSPANKGQNEAWLRDLIARALRAAVNRQGSLADLHYYYGAAAPLQLLPEVLTPEIYLSLAQDRNDAPNSADIGNSRPNRIGYETFGQPDALDVAFLFNIGENVLARI
jgi:hypothetical protein